MYESIQCPGKTWWYISSIYLSMHGPGKHLYETDLLLEYRNRFISGEKSNESAKDDLIKLFEERSQFAESNGLMICLSCFTCCLQLSWGILLWLFVILSRCPDTVFFICDFRTLRGILRLIVKLMCLDLGQQTFGSIFSQMCTLDM